MTPDPLAIAARQARSSAAFLTALTLAVIPAAAQCGTVDGLALEHSVVVSRASLDDVGGGLFGRHRASQAGSPAAQPLPEMAEFECLAHRTSSLVFEIDRVTEWRAAIAATGIADPIAFRADRDRLAVSSMADALHGSGDASAWSPDHPNRDARHGADGSGDVSDWTRRVRLGRRTAALTFYLSPSIPDVDHATY